MKNLVTTIAVVCLAITARAQNLTTVTASSLYKGGLLLSSGQICFTGTDANDNPIPFRVGGGGQEVTFPYCATVTNGAIVGTFQVANPANTAPANINYRVELFDQYNRLQKWSGVQFSGAIFNFDNYVPSANLPLGTSANVATIGDLTVTGSCTGCGAGGGGSGYATIENAGSAVAQRATANFFIGLTCADNSAQSRTDCQVDQSFSPTWTGAHTFTGTTNVAGTFQISGAAPQGKIPIGNGTSYVPGDPLVQGTQAAGSTTATNPVSVGGYDTSGTPVLRTETVLNSSPAGTEYGLVTRNIPSGTQTVSVSGTPSVSVSNTPAVTSSQLPSALDSSGFLKVHEQGTTTVSGTVTANAGSGTFNIQSNASVNVNQVGGNSVSTAATGVQKVGIVGNAGAAVDQAPGSAVPANALYIGGTDGTNLQGLYLDPCKRGAKTRFTINLTASGQIITGTASKKTYICDLDIVTATAQNIALVEGTGTTCATGTAGMAGGTTAATGWNFAANGGLTKGNGDGAVFSADSAAADNVCLLLSGSGQTSGNGHYVQY